MKPAPEKPALRVIEGYKGPPLPRRPKLPTDGELILPPIKLPWKEVFSTLAWHDITPSQSGVLSGGSNRWRKGRRGDNAPQRCDRGVGGGAHCPSRGPIDGNDAVLSCRGAAHHEEAATRRRFIERSPG